jgi:hypothetical protein
VIDQLQRNYEAVVGILHIIPTNLDVTFIFTSTLTLSVIEPT